MEGSISSVSTPDLIDQITELAGHLNAAHARWLTLIAEFDRRRARESQELTRVLTWFHDDDGSLVIRARLSAEAGAVFLKALAAAEDTFPIPDVSAETSLDPVQPRRALNSRDKGCRFPGCTFTRYVDGHHVRHWAQGGETKLSNLVALCRFHHRQVHEGNVVVQILQQSGTQGEQLD